MEASTNPKELYQASKVNKNIKEYIRNNINFPKTIGFLEDDVMHIIDDISPGRERAYLMQLSSELNEQNDESVIELLGIAIEMQIIAAYVKDDILDRNNKRNNHYTVNYKYNTQVAAIYSDLFLNISYLALEDIRQRITDLRYKDFLQKINESYKSICIGQIETACFNYSASDLILSICSLYERLVGVAYGHYCSMLITDDNTLRESLYLFGKNIGIALQVKNDISDFILDPSISGIPAYQDLLQGQPNIVIAYLLEHKKYFLPEEIVLLDQFLSQKYENEILAQSEENMLLDMLKKSGAISKAIDLFNGLLNKCLTYISDINDTIIKRKYTEFIETLIYE